jgi:RNA ligase (TIGR02306 family)
MSNTHKAEVVQIKLEKHPNADSLSIVKVGGFSVCVKTEDWKDGDLGVYIQPDSLVKTSRPEFSFLKTERIRVKKLRGVISMGLLIKPPIGVKLGDDVANILEIGHYEPELENTSSLNNNNHICGPSMILPSKYDIDNIRGRMHIFKDGEHVNITEKIEGQNGRYCYHNGEMFCGSRTNWNAVDKNNAWWNAYYNCPQLKDFCYSHPDTIMFGEVYGKVKGYKYGITEGSRFIAFDIWENGCFLNVKDFEKMCDDYKIQRVPVLYSGPFNFEIAEQLAEGKSTMLYTDHIREGCVIKPLIERMDIRLGRVILKLVGNGYLEGKKNR